GLAFENTAIHLGGRRAVEQHGVVAVIDIENRGDDGVGTLVDDHADKLVTLADVAQQCENFTTRTDPERVQLFVFVIGYIHCYISIPRATFRRPQLLMIHCRRSVWQLRRDTATPAVRRLRDTGRAVYGRPDRP